MSRSSQFQPRGRRIRPALLCGAVLAALLPILSAQAQDATGGIGGSVAGVVPADARIVIRNLGTGVSQESRPSASGAYASEGLNPGEYEVVLMSGDRRLSSSRVRIEAGKVASLALSAGGANPRDADAQEMDKVVVKGIRGSLESAQERKRNAKNIVDAIVSEDVGKLPDNNVPEALSRVTGVQLDRIHGEGSGVSIRGLTDIQTTINGNSSSVGEGRATNLADIPAELLKSVEVHKNRTADQVEGGIAGTVNVELRRPLDLPKGTTVAGSLRTVYSDIGKDWSPYGSVLWSNRFDTEHGEFGVLLNASYTENNYEENYVDSESPSLFFAETYDNMPAELRDVAIAPYAVNYGVEKGSIKRPSLNAVLQWKPSENLDFLLEGSYFGSNEKRQRDRLHLVVREWNYDLSDIELAPDGRTVQSVTVSRPDGVNGGPESYFEMVDSDNYTTNFETHWHTESVKIDGGLQYNWSKTQYYGILQIMRLAGATGASIDVNSPNVPGGGPYIDFIGADLGDLSSYRLLQLHDELTRAKSNELIGHLDLTYTPAGDGFVRSVQTGVRFTDRDTERFYGYRDAIPMQGGQSPALADFPTGGHILTTQLNLDGAANLPSWYHLSGADLYSQWGSVLSYLATNYPGQWWSSEWNSYRPQANRGGSYDDNEKTMAAYAQVNYGFDIGVPVDGTVGVRVTRTEGISHSANYRPDTVNFGPDIIQEASGGASYTSVLPSLNSIVHFTDKLQLRLAYTENMERPPFYELRPFAYYETRANPPVVYAGNPDLRPNYERSYDMSLEYYFGRAGSASLAAFLKKPDGFMYYSGEVEYVDQLGTDATVFQLRNAGPGEFRGYEFSVQSFFDFLPGKWSNFGASANFTYLDRYQIKYPFSEEEAQIPGIYDAPGTSKSTMNLALYYDTPKFSARLAYNQRSKRKDFVWTEQPAYSPYTMETSRLDAALNYTPYKFVTFSLEATNLLGDRTERYFGNTKYLPLGPRYEAKTYQFSVRMRWD